MPALGGAVVALPDRAEQPGRARYVHNRRLDVVSGLRPVAPVRAEHATRRERGPQLPGDDVVPLVFTHVDEHAISQHTGVVHQAVHFTEAAERGVEQALRALDGRDVRGVRDRGTACRGDLVRDLMRE